MPKGLSPMGREAYLTRFHPISTMCLVARRPQRWPITGPPGILAGKPTRFLSGSSSQVVFSTVRTKGLPVHDPLSLRSPPWILVLVYAFDWMARQAVHIVSRLYYGLYHENRIWQSRNCSCFSTSRRNQAEHPRHLCGIGLLHGETSIVTCS